MYRFNHAPTKDNPCHPDCPDRNEDCHGKCEKYREFENRNKELREKKQKFNERYATLSDAKIKQIWNKQKYKNRRSRI